MNLKEIDSYILVNELHRRNFDFKSVLEKDKKIVFLATKRSPDEDPPYGNRYGSFSEEILVRPKKDFIYSEIEGWHRFGKYIKAVKVFCFDEDWFSLSSNGGPMYIRIENVDHWIHPSIMFLDTK